MKYSIPKNKEFDFSNKNLRGIVFKNQDLSNSNFKGADIRGVNFKNAKLVNANFQESIAGISFLGKIQLLLFSIVGGFISGLFTVASGFFFLYALKNLSERYGFGLSNYLELLTIILVIYMFLLLIYISIRLKKIFNIIFILLLIFFLIFSWDYYRYWNSNYSKCLCHCSFNYGLYCSFSRCCWSCCCIRNTHW